MTTDFDLSAGNPNGVYSYGSRTTATGAGLNLFTNTYTAGGFSLWTGAGTDPNAGISGGGYGIAAGEFRMHPGVDSGTENFVVTRLTLPAGSYSIAGDFFAGDTGNVDTYVLVNGSIFDTGTKNNPFSGTASLLNASNTIEFVVGASFDNYGADSTGLHAVVQSVPEPAPMAALGLGALGLLRRRRAR